MSEPRKKKRAKKPKKENVQTINVGTSSKSRGVSSLTREPSTVSMEDVEPTEQTSNVDLFSVEDFQTIDTSSKSRGASSLPREPSSVSMEDVETEIAPFSKKDVKTINVDTSSKSAGKGKERASSPPREPSSVSMEDVESTEVAPSSKDREASSTTPSVEEIQKWKRADVINFLQKKKDELDLDPEDIKIIEDKKIAGQAFLLLTEEKLINIGLEFGPASAIAYLVETLKGGIVTPKRKYEESPEILTEIVRSAVRDEFSRQKHNKISVSDLSQSEMRRIMDDVGLRNIVLSDQDFGSLNSVSCNAFKWNTVLAEDQQMDEVVEWFKNVLNLPRYFSLKDVHTKKNHQRYLRGANVTLKGGTDIAIGPSETSCVWIETKKDPKEFNEGQAIGELFLIDKLHPTTAMTVLTDCNDYWRIYFFMTIEDKEQCIVTCNIGDRGVALATIREFILENGTLLHQFIGREVTYEAKLPEPFKKKAKFKELIIGADNEDRMADMVGDMSEQELFNMTVRKRLMLVRDFCSLDEQPQVDQLIRQFSDNYENPSSMMFT